MKKKYWLDRWKREETAFHQDSFNPYLLKYWQTLPLAGGSQVFVPLCGKSRDMLWLREQGHTILGVELSTLAIQAFFRENGLNPRHVNRDKFDHFATDNITILHGDFFDLDKNELVNVRAVYDRASMVALPPKMRKRYAHHMLHILPPTTQMLLISFDYPSSEMPGPPFAVSPDEVKTLYHKNAEIRLLTQMDILQNNPRFQARGLSRLQESIFLLTTRPE